MRRILTANPHQIVPLIEQNKIHETYLSRNYERVLENYRKNNFLSKFYVDRTGAMEHYLNVSNLYTIPEVEDTFNLSFYDVCKIRVEELCALGKPIRISWSGGLDSTFLVFFFHHLVQDPEQLIICGNYNSIIESGDLFDRYIKPNFSWRINPEVNQSLQSSGEEIIVNGSLSNQIFYRCIVKNPRLDAMLNVDILTKEMLEQPYERFLDDSTLEFFSPSISKSQRNIETLNDFRWWIGFNFNWNSNLLYHQIGSYNHNIHAFFDSTLFQKWAISNKDVITKNGEYTDDRWHLREFISQYIEYDGYSKTKRNFTSVTSAMDPSWLFMTDDYKNFYKSDL